MSNVQMKSLNFAVISCFTRKFLRHLYGQGKSPTRMKMFDCCEVSDIIGRRKLKCLQRYTLGLTVSSVWHVTSIWLETSPCLAAYVVHCLSDFVTCVSILSVFLFFIVVEISCYHLW